MKAGPRSLKIAGGLGTLVMCGTSGLVVAGNTKPAAAPLHPPANPGAPLTATARTSGQGAGSLTIPITPTCGNSSATGGVNAGTTRGGTAQTPPAKLDPAVTQVLAQLRQASSKQARQQVLQQAMQQLTPDQRLQLTAVLAAPGQGGGQRAMSGTTCMAGSGQPVASPEPDIAPSVVDAAPSTAPVTVSAVS